MNNLINKINKKENTIMVICILTIFAAIVFFFYLYSKEITENNFFYANSLEEQILSISSKDDDVININLQDFSYYVIVAEANTQSQALFFKEETPVNYWELKTSPIENVRSLTKEFCIETCIRDNILYMEAQKNNITLTEEELEYVQEISYDIYISLTAQQVDTTNISLNDINKAQEKIFLSEKYALSLVESGTIEAKSELSSNGAYYLEEIKTQYNIEENNDLINELVFGSITVNPVKE